MSHKPLDDVRLLVCSTGTQAVLCSLWQTQMHRLVIDDSMVMFSSVW